MRIQSAVIAAFVVLTAAVQPVEPVEPVEQNMREVIDMVPGMGAQTFVGNFFDKASPDGNAVKGSQLLDAFVQNHIDPYLALQIFDVDRDGLITRDEFTQMTLAAMERVPASSAQDERVTSQIKELLAQAETTQCPRKFYWFNFSKQARTCRTFRKQVRKYQAKTIAASDEQKKQPKSASRTKTKGHMDNVKQFFQSVADFFGELLIIVGLFAAALVALPVVVIYLLVFIPLLHMVNLVTKPFGVDVYDKHLVHLWKFLEMMSPDEEISHPDYYRVLGVPRDASLSEIKHKYYQLSRLYHADKYNNQPELKAEANVLQA